MKNKVKQNLLLPVLLLCAMSTHAQTWNVPASTALPLRPNELGTVSGGHFLIRSNNQARIRFNDGSTDFFNGANVFSGNLTVPNGFLGIGTSSMVGMVDVFNPISKNRVYINSGSFPSISFRNENANAGSWFHIHNNINTSGVNALQITHGGTVGQNVVASFGNDGLGIGIGNPRAKLDVQGGSIIQGTTELYDDAGNSNIRFNNTNNKTLQTGYSAILRFNKDLDGRLEYYNTTASSSNGATLQPMQRVFWVSKEGKFCIGNQVPNGSNPHTDWKLSVDGAVLAKKSVVTQLNWADDEFDKVSPSLKAEQEYASKEKHLIGVPSEKELTEKALDLGEMSAIQMRKIEQLYKHLWEQQQVIDKMQQEINKLNYKLK